MNYEKIIPDLNKEKVGKFFEAYPKLEIFIGVGSVSMKMAREILGIDRYTMYDIFKDLVEYGAVTPTGANCWRATPQLKKWIKERNNYD